VTERKRKFIEDAVRVIEGRIADLKAELLMKELLQPKVPSAADRAAILEAEHCARLVRALGLRPYRGDPYEVALDRWNHGEAN
jgi:hypothetical protein